MKTVGSLLIAGLFATLTFAVWAYLNRPTPEPPWPKRIQGFAFSPFRASEDPTHFEMPTDTEIDADLQLLEGQVNAVRTYSVGGTLSDVPELADRHGLNVALGAWPRRGRRRGSAVGTDADEGMCRCRVPQRAEQEQIGYYVMEAFDQPWKAYLEGAVGSYWGVYDGNRHPKFAFTAPIVRVPEWHILAAASVAVALVVLGLLYLNSDSLRNRGRSFLAVVVYATATIAVWVIYDFTQQYMTLSSVIAGVLLLLGMLGVMLVLLAEAHEWAEAHWVEYR